MEAPAGDPNPLITLFRQCVVRIDDGSGAFLGSGFFVAPGVVLTCAHVVHGAAGLTVTWGEGSVGAMVADASPPLASVADARTYPLPDVALLGLGTGFEGHPCVRLGPAPALGQPLYVAGHTREHAKGTVAFTGAGTVLESPITEDGLTFFKLAGGQVLPGFSGAPALNPHRAEVCGLVESTRDRRTDLGGFAVPVDLVAGAFPNLLAANETCHATDRRWHNAAEAESVASVLRAKRRPRLALDPPTVAFVWDENSSPADALRPRHAVVPYVGRQALLADIERWCETEQIGSICVWLVTGEGGFGKTRLAVEACLRAEALGWTAGLLKADPPAGTLAELGCWPGRLLVAVDYAETRPGVLRELVAELSAEERTAPVRLLLLVRRRLSRPELARLFNDLGEEELTGLLKRAPLSVLEETDREVDRLALFDEGLRAFASLLRQPVPAQERPRLRAAHFARPLYVLVAAALRAQDGGAAVDELSERDLLRSLLDEHEAHYWRRSAARDHVQLDPGDQRVAVALATLLTAGDEKEALALVGLVPNIGEDAARRIAIARWLGRLYGDYDEPSGRLRLGPLEPDRLGEVLVGDVLRGRPELLDEAVQSASPSQLLRVLTVAGRIAAVDVVVREQLAASLDFRLVDLFARAVSDEVDLLAPLVAAMETARPCAGALVVAERLPDVLPVWVRPFAIVVTALAVEGLREQAAADPEQRGHLAGWVNNLASRLSDGGRRDEALSVAEEAVKLQRELARADRGAFLADLAMSLNNLAARLAEVGRRDEALSVAEEAVKLYRELAGADRGAFLADLARSLNNLASFLGDVGRRDQALVVAEEAVEHCRKLAGADRGGFLADLAMSVNNLASFLSDVGRRDEALAVAEEAVELRRELAVANRGAFLPDLATSLNNLAVCLSGVGLRDEALAVAEEAVELRRELAAANPDAFLPNLALSLNNLANRLSDVGRRDEALAVAEEAVELRRELAAANPGAFLPNLATSLNNLANCLSGVGRRQEALAVVEEAVALRRELAGANRGAFLPDLAMSLSNLAVRLSDVGRRDDALDRAEESVRFHRELAGANRVAFLPDLAASLNNVANRLSDVGRREEALAVAEEAVRLYRELAGANRRAFLPDLSTSLTNLASTLSAAARREEAASLFDADLAQFGDTPEGLGHVLLARGRWWCRERLPEAIDDLTRSVDAFAEAGDLSSRAKARGVLRSRRRDGLKAFDLAWAGRGEAMPLWLAHPGTDVGLREELMEWIWMTDWAASQSFLDERAPTLLTDHAEAELEHLLDANPSLPVVAEHLALLQVARSVGVEAAYRAHVAQRWLDNVVRTLVVWIYTDTFAASRSFAEAYLAEVTSDDAVSVLEQWRSSSQRDSLLRLHSGLLAVIRAEGVEATYGLLDAQQRQAAIAAEDPGDPTDRLLALARMESGLLPDDSEAHFRLATIALLRGDAEEAAAALADCADHAAPFERRDFARRLDALATAHPERAPLLSQLRAVLDA